MRHLIVISGLVLTACPASDPSITGVCGDGVVDPSEQCDDGNLIASDACTDLCETARCGDGLLHVGSESCDDGNSVDSDACPSTCVPAACGDGFLRTDRAVGEPGYEACDDGNTDNGDACNASCAIGSCGDGLVDVELGEQCDDANDLSTDSCVNCLLATCGDGFLYEGQERCDDGNQNTYDACTNHCEQATCGDGFVRVDLNADEEGFEECDDGNQVDIDTCTSSCVTARCGDGFIQAGVETCDDANLIDQDACRNNCRAASCGDGVVRADLEEGEEGYESCDDGNQIATDSCTDLCLVAACGDGRVREDLVDPLDDDFEECDDGNLSDEDGCLNRCRHARCGDGVTRRDRVDGEPHFEGCDDGNEVNEDACTNACRTAQCGDGITRADIEAPSDHDWEDCDDGNTDDGDGCSAECFAEPQSVSVGFYHTCATTYEGPTYCWGAGTRGQLGNDGQDSQLEPVRVATPHVFEVGQGGEPGRELATHFTSVVAGGYHTCGITAHGGYVMCWGWNNQGQRGHGQRGVEFQRRPALVANTGETEAIAAGAYHTCARNRIGEVRCWGHNQYGQLGTEDLVPRYTPSQVSGLRPRAMLHLGPYISCTRTDANTQCFGSNTGFPMHPEAGGQEIAYTEPITVTQTARSRDFAVGGSGFACEVTPLRHLECWGNNAAGQANPSSQATGRQSRIRLRSNVSAVGLGHRHGCAHTTQQTVYCWGDNTHGQLGRQTGNTSRQRLGLVPGLAQVVELSIGEFSSCARTVSNQVWCWGKNAQGQLGDGSQTSRFTARRISFR